MPSKRNRCSSPDIHAGPSKKSKSYSPAYEGSDEESIEIGDKEYPIKCIIAETRTKYLIDWEGDYSPTWVRNY
jgi:hypothetical protein